MPLYFWHVFGGQKHSRTLWAAIGQNSASKPNPFWFSDMFCWNLEHIYYRSMILHRALLIFASMIAKGNCSNVCCQHDMLMNVFGSAWILHMYMCMNIRKIIEFTKVHSFYHELKIGRISYSYSYQILRTYSYLKIWRGEILTPRLLGNERGAWLDTRQPLRPQQIGI